VVEEGVVVVTSLPLPWRKDAHLTPSAWSKAVLHTVKEEDRSHVLSSVAV
jgi:hypothetical protein